MSPTRYRILASATVTEALRVLFERARSSGRGSEIVEALRLAMRQLEFVPLDVGESRDELTALGLQMRIVFVPPLVVRYAVNESERIVWLSDVGTHRNFGRS